MMTISSNGEQIKKTPYLYTYIHTCMHACMNAYTTKTFRLTTFHSSFCRSLFSLQYTSRCKPNVCKRNRNNGKQISENTKYCPIRIYGTPGNWRAQSAATNLHDRPTNRHSKSARECAILHCFGLVWFGLPGLVLTSGALNSFFLWTFFHFCCAVFFLYFSLYFIFFSYLLKAHTYVGDIRKEH